MDTKGPVNPPSQNKSHIHVIVDAFSHFVVTVRIKSNNAKLVVKSLLHHWIIKYGPLIYLVTDRGSEYINTDLTQLCTLMGIRHSPRTPYSLGQMVSLMFKVRNVFPQNTPKDWAYQVHMYAYAHNSQPLSSLNDSPHEIVFHTRPRIPLTFDLNLNRDAHQILYFTYGYTLRKINSHVYITKTYHKGKPLPLETFVLKRNFSQVHFSDKLKLLRIGPYKILDRLSDVTYELFPQDGSTFHTQRNHLKSYCPKVPIFYHFLKFMRFSDSTQYDISNPIN